MLQVYHAIRVLSGMEPIHHLTKWYHPVPNWPAILHYEVYNDDTSGKTPWSAHLRKLQTNAGQAFFISLSSSHMFNRPGEANAVLLTPL